MQQRMFEWSKVMSKRVYVPATFKKLVLERIKQHMHILLIIQVLAYKSLN